MQEAIKMPDDAVQAYHDNEVIDVQSKHGHRSVWMAHWKHTSYKSATQDLNHSSINSESKRDVKEDSGAEQDNVHGGSDVAIDISKSTGAIREATKATTVNFMNKGLTEHPGKSKMGSLDFKSFPIFNFSEKRDDILPQKREQYAICHGEVLKSQIDASFGDKNVSPNKTDIHLPSISAHLPPKAETLSRECHLWSEEFLPTNLLMKSSDAIEKNKVTVSASIWNDFVKSPSDMVPYAYNKGKTSMPSFTCGQREIYQSSNNIASWEHFASTNYHSCSSLLIREKKISGLIEPQTYCLSRLTQSGPAHVPHDCSASHNGGPDFVDDRRWKMQHDTSAAKFSGQTMKINNTIDSGEESSRGHPNISQTTHHFHMSESTDVNLSDRGQFLRESVIPTKLKGNTFKEISDFFIPIGENAPEYATLEVLRSSMDEGGKETVQDLKTTSSLKNESSAETDTMDINALRDDQLPGDTTLPSNKSPKEIHSTPTSRGAIISARERTKPGSTNIVIPDINQEPHALRSPVDERETSTSRTQSLDVDHLLCHVEEHGNSKSSTCDYGSLGPEPSSRWVKRLKSCTSDPALGTKSEKIGETSSREKVNKIFGKIMKGRKASLEPKIISLDEEQNAPDVAATISTDGNPSFVKAKQTAEVALSHPWIRRWTHNHAASSPTNHELMELREPQSSADTAIEEFQKKQFPSVAAMALMGKAMGSIHPCQLMKKGPVVVWNT